MPRVLSNSVISFGLIHIPVRLYAAEDPDELDLTMLDKRDMAPVGYKRVNKETGEEVGRDDIVKGYEYEDGRYVLLTEEELKRANVKATHTVDLLAFVDEDEIGLVYYEKPYYLTPDKGSEKGYALLREVLKRSRKVGIATIVVRTKQHIAALVPMGQVLVLNLMRYANEIRPTEELDLPEEDLKKARISEKEIQMALSLVEDMSEPWQPEQYHDTYRDDVLALIDEKIKAGKTEEALELDDEAASEPASSDVVDFMALLKKSIDAKKKKQSDEAGDQDEPPAKTSSDKAAAKKPAARKRA